MDSATNLDETPHLLALDEHTVAIFLQIPASKVAFLQSLIETYEGLGTVRTVNVRESLVALISTKEQLPVCLEILESLKPATPWSFHTKLSLEMRKEYFGFMKTETSESTF